MNVTIVGLLRIKFIDSRSFSNSPNTLVLNDIPAICNDCMTVCAGHVNNYHYL